MNKLLSPLSIAPMVGWTNTYFRVFMRLIAPHALLYTEMQTIGAIEYQADKSLGYHPCELPLALQLGGSDPQKLANCAKLAESLGFSEINLNLGCPSVSVQSGKFGVCLMQTPNLVSECISAMKLAVNIPVTAKIRIGIDKQDSYEFFVEFAQILIGAGCDKIIVHARKAWLHGLNPKQNRTIPLLHYDYVYRLKTLFKSIPIIINGNINDIPEQHMQFVDGIMIGRLAYQNPYYLNKIHQYFYPTSKIRSRVDIIQDYFAYITQYLDKPWPILIRPLLNFTHGLPNSKKWKLFLLNEYKQQNFMQHALDLLAEI